MLDSSCGVKVLHSTRKRGQVTTFLGCVRQLKGVFKRSSVIGLRANVLKDCKAGEH